MKEAENESKCLDKSDTWHATKIFNINFDPKISIFFKIYIRVYT